MRDIAARVLRNLKAAYGMQTNGWLPARAKTANGFVAARWPNEQRDLGLIHLRTGNPQCALSLLGEYVKDLRHGAGCRAGKAHCAPPAKWSPNSTEVF